MILAQERPHFLLIVPLAMVRLLAIADYKSGLQPSNPFRPYTWGFTPGWYDSAPLALAFILALMVFSSALLGCKPTPPPTPRTTASSTQYPPHPTTPPPPFHLFHATPDGSFTLVTTPTATDTQIAAIIYQLRDAAHTRTFDRLGIPQKAVDARDPMVWFHIYRSPKCAPEKYTDGKLPCGASYHAAGDYTFGGGPHKDWDDGVLLQPTASNPDHQTELWNPNAPYNAASTASPPR